MHQQEFPLKWHAEIIAFRNPGLVHPDYEEGCVPESDVLLHFVQENIILNQGKAEIIKALSTGDSRILARMAVGDRGALPSNPQVPKVPDRTRVALYHEVFRQDIQTIVTTTSGDVNEILMVATFNAVDIPTTSFLDQSAPMINECGLVLCDVVLGRPLPRPIVAAPALPDADELLFTHLPFNSVPFKAEEEVSVTVRYKVFVA
jgi:hypothetical protein